MRRPGRSFRAAIFDLDGLLVDSEPLWQRAEIECFGAVGVRLTQAEAESTIGLRSDEVVRRRFDEFGWDESLHPLEVVEERIVARVVELLERSARPMPGVEAALDFTASKGLRLALASSSRQVVIQAALRALRITDRFEVTHSGEFEASGKPDPAVYLTTARKLALPPESCIAFEDSIAGLEAAKAAGMACVVVPEGVVKGHRALAKADLVLPSLADLNEEAWRRLRSI